MVEKNRTVITTDGEVDDMNSFMRYLLYSNDIDTAGIILTSSIYHYAGNGMDVEPFRWTGERWIGDILDAYEKVHPNLKKHDPNYPTADYLRSIYHIGNISNAGEMEEVTDGSRFLEELILDDDPRTLYIQTWGGTNTTARALKSIEERYMDSPGWGDLKRKIEEKLVIYIILDQDVTYADYIAKHWKIPVLNDRFNFWYFAYFWKEVNPALTSRLESKWQLGKIHDKHNPLLSKYALIGDGNLIPGELYEEQRGTDEFLTKHPEYKRYDFISEGDSPSYLYLLNNGLRNAENPEYGGWGGRFEQVRVSLYNNSAVDYNPYTKRFEAEYSLTRWFDDIQDDFAARASWCLAENFEDVAHYPVVVRNHLDKEVEAGQAVVLETQASDTNNLELTYQTWCYFEASSYWKVLPPLKIEKFSDGALSSLHSEKVDPHFNLDIKEDGDKLEIQIPSDAQSGDTFHIITEVQNICETPFKTYVHRVLTVM
ncbi:DUF1593 domain-containing protein [Limosilactobacillus gorillae]|uniref:DUF1593 domain-containing protein n=1 Tax=Phoenicibacter congonensis TaxID=1944646 RepID=A0AA43RHD2_9ACTN|nr:DUF1593 domain-containing protein [Limosilactobacillus gorillae]MDO4841780.1 DUF1593 domain-containing protein [Phoenicibacter congonensis]